MRIRQIVCFFSLLFVASAFAAPVTINNPPFLQGDENSENTSLKIFDAFHTAPPPQQRAMVKPPLRDAAASAAVYPLEFRTFDGSGNNLTNNLLGAAETPFIRLTSVGYSDGSGSPAGADRQSARLVSNTVLAQPVGGDITNSQRVSSFVWQWGQFVDHDISLNRVANPAERFDIAVPAGDPQFDPNGTGRKFLPFQRSAFVVLNNIRQQVNVNSTWLDGSQVYGSGQQLEKELRTNDGTGQLKTSDGNMLPFNVHGFPNQPDTSATFFLAGDVRVNENIGLTSLQTLFMREHNFWAQQIKASDSRLKDGDIYLRARAIVGAEIELITYRDWLPIVLGPGQIPAYTGYNPDVDPTMANEFSTAAFRVGHTFLPPVLNLLDARNHLIGSINLGEGFFRPQLFARNPIDSWLRGLARQIPQEVDIIIDDSVRNFLIGGKPNKGGFDLASLNIQRGRDHGLAGYNQVRTDLGLAPKATFADMTSDPAMQAKLAAAYSSPDDVDFWVGGILEPHVNGGLVGETFANIIKGQMTRLRDGDRFWYEAYLDADTLATVQAQTLSTIIRRNTTILTELQDDAFHVP